MTNFKMTLSTDSAVSKYSPPPCVYESSCSLIVIEGESTLDRSPPCHTHSPTPPPVPAGIRNKANFLFHQLCLFIGFPEESRGTQLSVIHLFTYIKGRFKVFPSGSDSKASAYSEGDLGSIPGSGRSPGEGNGDPVQYSCLKNPMDRGAW